MEPKHQYVLALENLISIMDHQWEDIKFCAFGLWSDKGWYSPHGHMNLFEFHYFISGSTVLCNDKQIFTAKKGNFFFSDLSKTSWGKEMSYKVYYLDFSTENTALYRRLQQIFSVLSAFPLSLKTEELEEHFVQFCYEGTAQRSYADLIHKFQVLTILIKLHRTAVKVFSSNQNMYSSKQERIVNEMIQFFTENDCGDVRLKQLGEQYGMHEKYLNLLFKRGTGKTIHQYLLYLRIQKAKRLLGFTTLSMTDISYETGFCDCQHFSKTFKSLEGITPSEFRANSQS